MRGVSKRKHKVTFAQTSLRTWFERDSAYVGLENDKTGKTIIEWWDESLQEAVEDGFLNPKNWHKSAYEYAKYLGLITK